MKSRRVVLVVDDDSSVRDMLELVLKASNYVVRKAGSASEAIEIFREEAIDLVLSDVNMPNQTGPELLRELQTIDANVCFFFMTAGDLGKYSMEDLTESGAKLVIKKPFSVESILCCLDDLLREAKPHARNGPHESQPSAVRTRKSARG